MTTVVAPPTATADDVINGCTIVEDPTAEVHTVCRNTDLKGIDLSVRQMQYADFAGSDLSNADLSFSDYAYTNFSGTKLVGTNFAGTTPLLANFNDADLSGADLTGTFWVQTTAQRIKLVNADLTDARLLFNDFTDADLTEAELTRADFGQSTIANANFTKTLLLPPDQQLPDADDGAVVEWVLPPGVHDATAVECDPPSGSAFPSGTTTVRCIVSGFGSQGFGEFAVEIGRDEPSSGSSGSSSGSSANNVLDDLFG